MFVARLFSEASLSLAYYVGPEFFEPLFVPFSFSMCNFSARFITIAAPQVAEIKPRQVSIIVFVCLCVIGSIAASFL